MNKNEQLQRHIADLESKNSSLQLSIDRLTVNLQRVEGEEIDLKEKVSGFWCWRTSVSNDSSNDECVLACECEPDIQRDERREC